VTPPMRWLALLAAGGAIAGGMAALGHTSSAVAGTTPTVGAAARGGSTNPALEVRRLIAETSSLQAALSSAREELGRALSRPGGRTLIYRSTGSSSAANLSGLETQLAAEQSALSGERAQLQGEQLQLGSEAQMLSQRQAQLVKEAAALAAEAEKLRKPPPGDGGDGGGGGGD